MPAPSARHIEPLLPQVVTRTLAGSIASTSTLTGALTATAPLAGTSAATSSLTGALTNTAPSGISVAGTIAATSSLTGALSNTAPAGISAVGTITATSSLTGELTLTGGPIAVAGTIAATSSLVGDLNDVAPHVPTTRYAIHWFWEPDRYSECPATPLYCPLCGSKVVLMTHDLEVFTRHYEAGYVRPDGTVLDEDCPYIATLQPGNYAQPLVGDPVF